MFDWTLCGPYQSKTQRRLARGEVRIRHISIGALHLLGSPPATTYRFFIRFAYETGTSIVQLYYVSLSSFFLFVNFDVKQQVSALRGCNTNLHSRWTTQPSAGYPGRQRGAEAQYQVGRSGPPAQDVMCSLGCPHIARTRLKTFGSAVAGLLKTPAPGLADFDDLVRAFPAWRGERHFISHTLSHERAAQG